MEEIQEIQNVEELKEEIKTEVKEEVKAEVAEKPKEQKAIKVREKMNVKDLTKEQQLILPMYDNYLKMYPNIEQTRAYQVAMNFAYTLANTKNKADHPAIETCTKDSILMAFNETMKNGIDLTLNQGALIPRGRELKLQLEYFGWLKLLKDYFPNSDVKVVVVYEGEPFNIEVLPDGNFRFNHTIDVSARAKGVIAATYFICSRKVIRKKEVIETIGERTIKTVTEYVDYEILGTDTMTKAEIDQAWNKASNGLAVHNQFSHEMAKKTQFNRGCKHMVKTVNTINPSVFINVDDDELDNAPFEYDVSNVVEADIVATQRENEFEATPYIPSNPNDEVYDYSSFVEKPKQEPQAQASTSGYVRIPYKQYKNEINLWEKEPIPNAYDSATRTISVRRK